MIGEDINEIKHQHLFVDNLHTPHALSLQNYIWEVGCYSENVTLR